jgi:hypothetical protein
MKQKWVCNLRNKKILKTLLYRYCAENIIFLSLMHFCAISLNVEPHRLSLGFLRSLVCRDSIVSYLWSWFFRTNSLMPRRISGCTHEGKWFTLGSFLAHFHFLNRNQCCIQSCTSTKNSTGYSCVILLCFEFLFSSVWKLNLILLHIPVLLYHQCWIVSDSKRKRKTHTHTLSLSLSLSLYIYIYIYGNDVWEWTIILIQVTLVWKVVYYMFSSHSGVCVAFFSM